MSLELQHKILRVLRDQKFERLGSVRTIQINVRVPAALPNKRRRNRARSQEAHSGSCKDNIRKSLARCTEHLANASRLTQAFGTCLSMVNRLIF
jgi:DNA-binding NtrC family response regulator